MDRKILLFARDPGGANSIVPLVEPLKANGYYTYVFGKDSALSVYNIRAVQDYRDITKYVDPLSQNDLGEFLRSQAPDFIITGTSADDMTEKYIWTAAQGLNIPCFAIVDQWINYGIRFSSFGVSDMRSHDRAKKYPYLPTRIIVMDEFARDEMVKEGIPSSLILVCGQPHFEYLRNYQTSRSNIDLYAKLGIDKSDIVITFASEPIVETYHESHTSDHYWGYTERTIFSNLLDALRETLRLTDKRVCLIVRPHPKESTMNLADLYGRSGPRVKIVCDTDSHSLDLVSISHLVCGMSSMFLIEAVVLGKPVLSVQIGLRREDPFILSRRGIVTSILDFDALVRSLKSVIIEKSYDAYRFPIIHDPVHRIIISMEHLLCPN
jgi:hypothetical protein